MSKHSKTMTVRFNEETHEVIEALAKERGISKAELLRELIGHQLNEIVEDLPGYQSSQTSV